MAYVVLGLGRTGLAVVRYLKKRQFPIIVADTRMQPPNLKIFQQKFPEVVLHVGALPIEAMLNAQAVIAPPGLALTHPIFETLKEKNVPVWGDIELFAQQAQAPAIAITGANGKSTVTSLVGAMAKSSNLDSLVGGNIGVPALDLLESQTHPQCYVLELSSFQLETTYSLKPQVACILNITRDHLDRHGSLDAYVKAKQRIYHGAQWAIYNRHDVLTKPTFDVPHSITFGLDEPKTGHFGIRTHNGLRWVAYGSELWLPVNKILLFGRHNVLNALSALSIGTAFGFSKESMLKELQTFKDLKHRCQFIKKLHEVTWINDSKGTNVGATVAAIESVGEHIHGKIVLIAGGKAKDTDFSDLKPWVSKYVKQVLLIGQDGHLVGDALKDCAPCLEAGTMNAAVSLASNLAKPGDAVLLSPACTSLDVYANFEERGDAFVQAVQEVK
ncbi:MAG TPA: UDP-N-acetylmuramoyl-L-alanine--D-glutamate ligase [Gammaproteobacteria bacterium]|nr:UDP-N-acetylmuramoyl-L-alanine--D-glutamate ligase [Gammaproteobacteria bacterium]